jgi:S-adenosylmethionine:tRNA ribosyltransferase-isomerase
VDISDFDYDLPPSAIAQAPLPERDASRLLVLDRVTGQRTHRMFRDLPDLLAPGDLLVTNRSRVAPARLCGHRVGGGVAELLLVRSRGGGVFEALVKPGRRLKAGSRVLLADGLEATVGGSLAPPDSLLAPLRLVTLQAADGDLDGALDRAGRVPLPPYIKREASLEDRERYQTVYAREAGSVAAPTAGLHFSNAILARLEDRGILRSEVLLHVGPGTFQPVKVQRIEEHRVAPEPFLLPTETARAVNNARHAGRRIVAVGTTTARVLETSVLADGTVAPGNGETALVIVPGFTFRVVSTLVTNFHLPRSSLLLLAAAFAGRKPVLDAYAEAITRGYRFYSYGDAMLIL